MINFPPKLLIDTTLCNQFIKSIKLEKKWIIPLNEKLLLFLALKDDIISVIRALSLFTTPNTENKNFDLQIT